MEAQPFCNAVKWTPFSAEFGLACVSPGSSCFAAINAFYAAGIS